LARFSLLSLFQGKGNASSIVLHICAFSFGLKKFFLIAIQLISLDSLASNDRPDTYPIASLSMFDESRYFSRSLLHP